MSALSTYTYLAGITTEDAVNKVRDVYGVDISDIEDGNLARIFQRISKP